MLFLCENREGEDLFMVKRVSARVAMRVCDPARAPFLRGDRVRLDYDPGLRGTVVGAGPEQSEVCWDGSRRGDVRVHSNGDLVKLIKRVTRNAGLPSRRSDRV